MPKDDLIALTRITPADCPLAQSTLRRKVQLFQIPHVRKAGRIFISRAVLKGLAPRPQAFPARGRA